MESAHSTRSSRRDESGTQGDDEDSRDSEHSRTPKFPRIEDIADLVQKRLNQTSQQFLKGSGYSGLRPSDSPLSGEITTLRFSKFLMPIFDHYSRTSYPLLHLRQYQDKMMVCAHDNLLLCRAFPSSLKGATYHWFYSLPKNSLQSFHEVMTYSTTSLLLEENFRRITTIFLQSR